MTAGVHPATHAVRQSLHDACSSAFAGVTITLVAKANATPAMIAALNFFIKSSQA
jgi:hypothetical protein